MVANIKTVRRTSEQVAHGAESGLQAWRLRRRIPVMGVLDATGEPGEERIRWLQEPVEDVTIDVTFEQGVPTGPAEISVVEHADVTFEYLED